MYPLVMQCYTMYHGLNILNSSPVTSIYTCNSSLSDSNVYNHCNWAKRSQIIILYYCTRDRIEKVPERRFHIMIDSILYPYFIYSYTPYTPYMTEERIYIYIYIYIHIYIYIYTYIYIYIYICVYIYIYYFYIYIYRNNMTDFVYIFVQYIYF